MRLQKYDNVFVEDEDNTFELYGSFHIFHNCSDGAPCWKVELMEYGEPYDEEYLCIDDDSFQFVKDIFIRCVVDFDSFSEWNPIKPEVYRRIRAEMMRLIEELSLEKKTYLTINCFKKAAPLLLKTDDCTQNDLFQKKQVLIDYCSAFLWYFDEYKQFRFDDNGRIINFRGW